MKLNRPFFIHEVHEAVFSVDANNCAGLEGFSSLLYQHCQDIIQDNVYRATIDFYEDVRLPCAFADTSIVLILKKKMHADGQILG